MVEMRADEMEKTDQESVREFQERFWARVDRSVDCWRWKGSLSDGYGQFYTPQKVFKAHRFAYELLVGPIPAGKVTDHLCRNRACVNPAHIEIVDNRTNVMRGVGITARNANKTHCEKGHPYNETNTRLFIEKDGSVRRDCRECRAVASRKSRLKRRARKLRERQQ